MQDRERFLALPLVPETDSHSNIYKNNQPPPPPPAPGAGILTSSNSVVNFWKFYVANKYYGISTKLLFLVIAETNINRETIFRTEFTNNEVVWFIDWTANGTRDATAAISTTSIIVSKEINR